MIRINLANPKYIGYHIAYFQFDTDTQLQHSWAWIIPENKITERELVEMPNDNESYSERSRRQQSEQERFFYFYGK